MNASIHLLLAAGLAAGCQAPVGSSGDGAGAAPGGTPAGADLGAEEGPTACANGVDDDGDGYIDCLDRDCALTAGDDVCPPEGATSDLCGDGVDNDGDGFVDGSDDGCTEDTLELCTDGLDNDGNGYADCADYACSKNSALDLGCPAENTDEACNDGVDNDGNGYTDCDDYGCSRNDAVSVCGGGGEGGGGEGGGAAGSSDGSSGGSSAGGGGEGDEAPCGVSAPAGVCADPGEVCEAGQCTPRSEDQAVPSAAGDLLITEFLANVDLPDVPDNESKAEWFEIHNTMDRPVDLRGLSVRDDGSDSFVVGGPEPLVILAGGYAVLGRSADTSLNGDIDVIYAYGGQLALANGADELALQWGDLLLDHVAYDGDFPHAAGVTAALNPDQLDHERNDALEAWCAGDAAWSATSGQKGSPGAENPPCD